MTDQTDQKEQGSVWTPATMGRKGGQARVPKGIAMLPKKQRRALAKLGAEKRWGSKKGPASEEFGPESDRKAG